jgi:hypothetical protein
MLAVFQSSPKSGRSELLLPLKKLQVKSKIVQNSRSPAKVDAPTVLHGVRLSDGRVSPISHG